MTIEIYLLEFVSHDHLIKAALLWGQIQILSSKFPTRQKTILM